MGQLCWSPDGRYLLSRNENMPSMLWVWDVTDTLGLCCVLLHSSPVKSAQWSTPPLPLDNHAQAQDDDMAPAPSPPQLAIVRGARRFFVWSPESDPCWYDVPSVGGAFDASRVRWAPGGGGALAIMTADQLCVCTLQQ